MKIRHIGSWAAWAALFGSAALAQPPPAEDFSHQPAFKGHILSPDGKILAYNETLKGDNRIFLVDLATNKRLGLELLGSSKPLVQGSNFFWANNRRFVYSVRGTYTAIDRDGRNAQPNIQGGWPLYLFRDDKLANMLMTGQDITVGAGMTGRVQWVYSQRPYVQRVSAQVKTGMSRGLNPDNDETPGVREVENPGNVIDWVITGTGEVRAATEIKGTSYRVLYRDTVKSSWGPLPGLDWSDPESFPLGFSADAAILYVGRISPEGTWAIYPYQLANRQLGEALVAHPRYDVVYPYYEPSMNGVRLNEMIYSLKTRELLGVRYVTDYPRMLWLEAGLAEVQAALDAALPSKVNSIVSLSDDQQRLIVLSWSSRDPGTYYLFDRGTQKLEKLTPRMPWLDPDKMAEMHPVRYKARDGEMIHGYITLPLNREVRNLPLVILPHGRPWGRTHWGFDPTAQFLASRGYAVLQANYRGSVGYGSAFFQAGDKQALLLAQADLADGVRWAVEQKLADPARIAIVGEGNFGGGIALAGMVSEPALYCCGVSNAGFSDWMKTLDKANFMPDTYQFLMEKIGNPEVPAEAAVLREASPINHVAKFKRPVLITHDDDDMKWIYNQSRSLATGLRQAGAAVEFVSDYNLKYGYENRGKWLREVEAFLNKHMPAN